MNSRNKEFNLKMLLISHNSRKRKKETKPSHNEELFSKLTL